MREAYLVFDQMGAALPHFPGEGGLCIPESGIFLSSLGFLPTNVDIDLGQVPLLSGLRSEKRGWTKALWSHDFISPSCRFFSS